MFLHDHFREIGIRPASGFAFRHTPVVDQGKISGMLCKFSFADGNPVSAVQTVETRLFADGERAGTSVHEIARKPDFRRDVVMEPARRHFAETERRLVVET